MKTIISSIHFLLILILVFFLAFVSFSHGATLAWDANTEEDLAGYKVYYRASTVDYYSVVDVGDVTEYELCNLYLYEGLTYYIAVTAYDTSGNESELSDVKNCIGDICECEGDLDCDEDVDGSDVLLFKADFGRNSFNNPCPSCVAGDWCSY